MSDLAELKPLFIQAVEQTLESLSAEAALRVRARLIGIVGSWSALYLFSKDHFDEKNEEIFQDEIFRDWLFNVRFVFMTNASFHYGHGVHAMVLDTLARSASLDMGVGEDLGISDEELVKLSAMPAQFPQEILNYQGAKQLLAANNWMVAVLLSIAFIPLEHEVLKTPGPNNNQNK